VIVFEGFYLWKDEDKLQLPLVAKQEPVSKEKNGLTITPIREDSPEKSSREMQGVSDSGFETNAYGDAKKIVSKNANAKLAKEQAYAGKQSFQINWAKNSDAMVKLSKYVEIQNNAYYKIGMWISSEKSGQLGLYLGNDEEKFLVAEIGIVANEKNKFRYYEYNFYAPLSVFNMELVAAGTTPNDIFLDNVSVKKLNIKTKEELAGIKVTESGSDYVISLGEKQTEHSEVSNELANPKILLGQTFIASQNNLVGVEFFMDKRGNGGEGEYLLELRDIDEKTQLISQQKIAVTAFSAKDMSTGIKNFPLIAKLEKEKKYWIGINNSAIKVSKENYLSMGQSKVDSAYAAGNVLLQKAENKFFTEEKDLYFVTRYAQPQTFSFGETSYDLGSQKKRLEYQWNVSNGANVLDMYNKKNITLDKGGSVVLSSGDSYVVYQIKTNGQKINKLMIGELLFHNNIQASISVDGKEWTEIFAGNPEKTWQNSGRIAIAIEQETQNIFLKMKKNGDGNSIFLGMHVILEIENKKID
jgi:hypothetical protein